MEDDRDHKADTGNSGLSVECSAVSGQELRAKGRRCVFVVGNDVRDGDTNGRPNLEAGIIN